MSQTKYYAVAKGRKPGIYLTWEECKQSVFRYSNPKFKSFNNKEDAEAFFMKYNNGRLPKKQDYADPDYDAAYAFVDNCVLCGRPYKQKKGKNGSRKATPLCQTCKNQKKHFIPILKKISHGQVKNISADELLYIKQHFVCGDNIFTFLESNLQIILFAKANTTPGLAQKTLSQSRKETRTYIPQEPTPKFVKPLLGEGRELIRIEGDKRNPRILFHCKRCGNDLVADYRSLAKHKGHDCSGLISSGHSIVQDYLEKLGVKYRTERDTLKCVNPDTGYVMPYDFEIPSQKIIIEVQGDQHRNFIEWFHVDEEGFKYQQKKDAYKKKFAEDAGYKVVYIWYSDFQKGQYKEILYKALDHS